MRDRVLVLNAGSSTLKASVLAEGVERAAASITVPMRGQADAADALHHAVDGLGGAVRDPTGLRAVGHRVVHGGSRFTRATVIDDAVLQGIRDLAARAPLHNPVAAEVIAAARAAFPTMPHVAAFDTAFHATLPIEAYLYALPYEWHTDWGYRRYGFHGLSVSWSVERAGTLLGRRDLGIVVAHLGAGCSVSAVWQGRSVNTSMGLTPLEGLMMATRAGSVDPGVLLAAQREHSLDLDTLEATLEHRSGLLGVSGRTADMRELIALAPGDDRAALAIAMFSRSAAAAVAAAATALPRLDAIVFTGGIGEHAATVRADIVRRLAAIGVPPVADEPVEGDAVLVARPVAIVVIVAREDVVIAREAIALIA